MVVVSLQWRSVCADLHLVVCLLGRIHRIDEIVVRFVCLFEHRLRFLEAKLVCTYVMVCLPLALHVFDVVKQIQWTGRNPIFFTSLNHNYQRKNKDQRRMNSEKR